MSDRAKEKVGVVGLAPKGDVIGDAGVAKIRYI